VEGAPLVSGEARRPKVLLVEPHKELRVALEDALDGVFDVYVAQTLDGARLGFKHHQPPVVVASMKQADGRHGLQVIKAIREVEGGAKTFTLVYGVSDVVTEKELDGDLKAEWGVDRYLARAVTIKKLHGILTERLRLGWKPMRSVVSGPVSDEVDPPEPVVRSKNPMMSKEVVSARKEAATDTGIWRRIFGK